MAEEITTQEIERAVKAQEEPEPQEDEEEQTDNDILSAFLDQEESDEEGPEEDSEEDEAEEQETEEEEEGEDDDALRKEEEGEEEGEGKEEEGEAVEIDDDALVEITVNKQKQKVPFSQLKADAQKVRSATERFQQAAEKEREIAERETKIGSQEKHFNEVLSKVKEDPIGAAFHLLAGEKGEEAAYEYVLQKAAQCVGKEMEYQSLPEEEKIRRRSETVLSRREREIEQLKRQNAERDLKEWQDRVARELTEKAAKAGITQRESLYDIGTIFDRHATTGNPKSVDDCIEEYLTRRREQLKSLSDDELKELGLTRAQVEQTSSKPKSLGRVVRGKQRRASTSQAKRKRRGEKPKTFFSNYQEAWRDAQKR